MAATFLIPANRANFLRALAQLTAETLGFLYQSATGKEALGSEEPPLVFKTRNGSTDRQGTVVKFEHEAGLFRVADIVGACCTDHWDEHNELEPDDPLPGGPWVEVDHTGLATLANAVSVILKTRVRIETDEPPCPAVLLLVAEVVREGALFAREAHNQRQASNPKARKHPLRVDEARFLAKHYMDDLLGLFVPHTAGSCPCCRPGVDYLVSEVGLLSQREGTPPPKVPKERRRVPHLDLSRYVCRLRSPFKRLKFGSPAAYLAAASAVATS